MRANPLKQKIEAGEGLLGSWLSVAHPTVAEVMGQAGYDWLIADMEHGLLSLDTVLQLIQVVDSTPAASLVRVPWNDQVVIKQVMEMGPKGLIIPLVNSAAEAEDAVRAASYPPRGIRGIGCQRAAGFGASFTDYLQHANEHLFIGVQIEHVRAVENVEAIAAVDGVNLLFIGANDLSASMGLVGQPGHPRVQEAIVRVLEVGRRSGVAVGLMAADPDDASRRFAEGFQFVGIGHDVGLLSQICRDHCGRTVRQAAAAVR